MKKFISSLTLTLILPLLTHASLRAQAPYLGGSGDGYASAQGTVSLVREAIYPDWARVFQSPVVRGTDCSIVVLDVASAASVTLYDAPGRRVWQARRTQVAGTQSFVLATGSLAAGCYLLQVNRDDRTFTQKLIVWDN